METKQILDFILSVDNVWIYLVIFFFAYVENVFPPSPSDVIVVFCASLSGLLKDKEAYRTLNIAITKSHHGKVEQR